MSGDLVISVMMFLFTSAAVLVGASAMRAYMRSQHERFDTVLRQKLLLSISPTVAMAAWGMTGVVLAIIAYSLSHSIIGAFLALVAAGFLPRAILNFLANRRVNQLELQLVGGVQTLASGVRAGLNLPQAMTMVARDADAPLRQEFAHLVREYEYGVPLDEAMDNAAARIGSGDFRLLFSALQTHRERGGNLAETLDRIAESIREIQRLENRVKTLTAQGRANARMMTAVVFVALGIYYLIDPNGVRSLFAEDVGKVIIGFVAVLLVLAFLWIRKIIAIDI